eukprot:361693-Chlamydomonas_euryale.AAC.3
MHSPCGHTHDMRSPCGHPHLTCGHTGSVRPCTARHDHAHSGCGHVHVLLAAMCTRDAVMHTRLVNMHELSAAMHALGMTTMRTRRAVMHMHSLRPCALIVRPCTHDW